MELMLWVGLKVKFLVNHFAAHLFFLADGSLRRARRVKLFFLFLQKYYLNSGGEERHVKLPHFI